MDHRIGSRSLHEQPVVGAVHFDHAEILQEFFGYIEVRRLQSSECNVSYFNHALSLPRNRGSLSSICFNDIVAVAFVKTLDQFCTAGQHSPLIDITFIGDLTCVNLRWFRHQEYWRDPRRATGIIGIIKAKTLSNMIVNRGAGNDFIKLYIPACDRLRPRNTWKYKQSDIVPVLPGYDCVLDHWRCSGNRLQPKVPGMHPGSRQQFKIFRDAPVENDPLRRIVFVFEFSRISDAEKFSSSKAFWVRSSCL